MAKNSVPEWDATASNNTDVGGISIAEGMTQRANVNNAMREIMAQVKEAVASQGSDIASASTTDIGAATGPYVKVTGTTTITALGTVAAGTPRWVEFTGALTLTHNATSLKLPTSANITTAAGDTARFVSLGSGNWKCLNYMRMDGTALSAPPTTIGKHKLWIPAAAMRPDTTIGAAAADVRITNVQYYALDFDQSSTEAAHFTLSMPSSWDEGTVTYIPVWTAASGTGDVVWLLQAQSVSNDDAIPASHSGGQSVTDTLIATGDLHRGAESSALTVEGTPAANDIVLFRILRFASDGGDTLNADARLLGIELFITTNAAVDVA